jgi:pectate lyase/pectin methylesterase-like acyl-CoA thioesterase
MKAMHCCVASRSRPTAALARSGWLLRGLLGPAMATLALLAAAQTRPVLDDAAAATQQRADYLAQGAQAWSPPPFAQPARWTPDFVVAADGSGTHRRIQDAVDAAPAAGTATRRHRILIKPGVYRERLCVASKAPLTLYGVPGRAADTVIVEGRYNALHKRAGVEAAHPCFADLQAPAHGTPGSASVVFASDDLQAAHLTIANDSMEGVREGQSYPEGAGESGGAQGIALMTLADRIVLDAVRLIGHQDTFHVRRPSPSGTARVLVRGGLIAGDVDFIFGNATLVIDDSTILSRAQRRTPGNGGHVLAPSTPHDVRLGFLVQRSRFVAEPGVAPSSISLGRAWDEGVARGAWKAGASPNGQALVRDSLLGPHIAPWAASTSRRPFQTSGLEANRMHEYANRALPERIEREVLGPDDGWAAAVGGTRGGAEATPERVFDVRTRKALAAALAGAPLPRIVRIRGTIDLSTDDDERPLAAADYRDADFSWDAFGRAYDPATWGRADPHGALEDARRRSAHRQAERVVMRVPSNTTIIGVDTDARIVHGGLLLERVDNVIVRNIHFSDAYDHFPAWEPRDNGHGEWNAEYDTLSLREATHVWVDHCTFDNGPDKAEPTIFGRPMQPHDGLLDITKQSNHVTVSWNRFVGSDKASLVGSGDGQTADEGRLKITFHHNLWEDVRERAPRVRYGQVHVYNNLHVITDTARYGYSLGIGHRSRIFSQDNAWEWPADAPTRPLLRWWGGQVFADRGSLLNGHAVNLLDMLRAAHPGRVIDSNVGWTPSHALRVDHADEVADRVRAHGGAGRMWLSASRP